MTVCMQHRDIGGRALGPATNISIPIHSIQGLYVTKLYVNFPLFFIFFNFNSSFYFNFISFFNPILHSQRSRLASKVLILGPFVYSTEILMVGHLDPPAINPYRYIAFKDHASAKTLKQRKNKK